MSMYEGPNLSFDNVGMHFLLDNPAGPTGRHLRKIGLFILRSGRKLAGRDTGRLRRSMYMRQHYRGRVQYVEVGAKVPYAYDHHEGTRRHTIRATPGRVMRFNVGGKVVYAKKVDHPGTKATKFLTTPMRIAVKRL